MNPNYDGNLESPNDMMVDPAEFVTEQPEDEKTDVTIINPDQLGSDLDTDIDMAERLRADNFEAMKEIVLPPLEALPPTLDDQVHTWHIEKWRSLSRKEHGPIFHAGGFPWRVLMFPNGNNIDHASFYLEQAFPDQTIPDDFVCCVQFGLVLWNPNDPTLYQYHTAHHRFTKDEGDWGFTRFVELRKLWSEPWDNSRRPLVENEEANMTAYVRVVEDETGVLWHNFINYDSKKETGFVGLKNQGATCYLNSLIQSLYFTNAFRKAVYQIPTQDEADLTNSAYTLQRLFYQLQISNSAVGTNELTKSFGWETKHIFEQQDVQELSRKLMERMEAKMKNTEAETLLPKLFSGKLQTYISCINVDYDSRRTEDFWDIQMNVSGNKDLIESFQEYIQVETMEGENQYFAGDEFKLQDARKGVIFESFPDVLNLQLKRFTYDIDKDAMTKLNDRYEFPETFDAAPYLSEAADKSEPYIYRLHSVLVHSGDLNAGHYYAFIKPNKEGWFYRYDDDKVTKATMREVLEESFGGEFLPPAAHGQSAQKTIPIIRHNSAYMLVYIRETRIDQVLLPVTKEDTPPHLQKRLEEEAAEREARKKEREEAHLYLNVKVITDDTYRAYGGTDLTAFDLKHEVDPSAPRAYRLLRKSTIQQLIDRVAQDTDCESKRLRMWCMVNRQNKTVRPDLPITETSLTVEEVHHRLAGTKTPELRLWAELAEELTPDGDPIWPTYQLQINGTTPKTDLIVLFLKWFNVEQQTLTGVGHIYISREKKVEELVPVILDKMLKNYWEGPVEEPFQLRLFEEIKPSMIEPMKAKQTLKAAELQDGDIVCFQRVTDGRSVSEPRSSESDRESVISRTSQADRIEDVRLYYDFLIYKRNVRFQPHPRTQGVEGFSLLLNSKHTYDQFAARVADKLGVLPTHLKFYTVNNTTGTPKAAVKRVATQTLQAVLSSAYSYGTQNQKPDALFFEILDMSLAELDTKKVLKVIWLSEGITKEDLFEILVPKNGNVEDIIAAVIKKGQLDDEVTAGPIQIYEVRSHRIHKSLPRDHPVTQITDNIQLIAERLPEEDLEQSEFIYAFHFQNDHNKAHGVPFAFHIKEDEKFADTRKRLEKRTGLKGKSFEKIKFAVVKKSSYAKPIYLNDDDILWDVARDDDSLGLDHVDRTRVIRNGAGDLFLR